MIEMSPAMTDSFRIKDIWFSSLSFCLALFFLLSHRRDVIAQIVAALFSAVACTRCDGLAGVSSFHANLKICFFKLPLEIYCLPCKCDSLSSSWQVFSFFLLFFKDFDWESVNMNFGGWLTISGRASNLAIPGSNPGLAKRVRSIFPQAWTFVHSLFLGDSNPSTTKAALFLGPSAMLKKLIRRHFR